MQNPKVEELHELALQVFQIFTAEDLNCLVDDVPPTARFLKFLDLMRQVLQVDPDEPRALSNVAQMASVVSLDEARQAAERLVQVDRSYHNYAVLGKILLRAGDFERAGDALDKALALGSDFYLWMNLAVARANTGHLQEALDCVENGLRLAEAEHDVKAAVQLRDQILGNLDRIHGGKP